MELCVLDNERTRREREKVGLIVPSIMIGESYDFGPNTRLSYL